MKGNTKVLLISICDSNCLNIRQLHNFLSQKGYDVKTLFFKDSPRPPSDKEWFLFTEFIKKNKVDIVCLSVRSALFYISTRITKIIRQNSNALIIFGGIQPTLQPELALKYADIVCIGDGEIPLKELIDSLDQGRINYNIKGLWFKKGDRIIKNDVRKLENLDEFAFTDYGDENKFYIADNKIDVKNPHPIAKDNYYIVSMRGCPFSCTYCCNSRLRAIFKNKGNYLRRRSVDNVIEELKVAKQKCNPKLIQFWDDVFTFDIKWISEFADKYKKEIGIPFFCYTDPRCCPEDILRKLVDAGLVKIEMGIQTGSESIRKEYYDRHETNEQIVKVARLFQKYGLFSSYNLMIENPYETEYDKRETLKLMFRLPKPVRISIGSLTMFPTYPLTERALNDNKIAYDTLKVAEDKILSTRYARTISIKRNKEDLFWNFLYTLVMVGVPDWLINKFSYSKFLRKNIMIAAYALDRLIAANNYIRYTIPKRTIADKFK